MLKHHVPNIELMLKHHAQNRHYAQMQCSYNLFSKAETFIHVAIQNFKNVVIVHRAQHMMHNSWTTGNFLIPVLAYRKQCILVRQTLDILVTLTNSVLH